MDCLLKGLRWVNVQGDFSGDIRIRKGFLAELGPNLQPQGHERTVEFKNRYVYPGLINSHDHLEMNLYPRLGHPPYGNYTEWGHDIYKPGESPISEIEKIAVQDRLLWGGLKNLISGVTTVIHHNPWNAVLSGKEFPIKVLKDVAWSHSLSFGKNLAADFPKKSETPYVIHAAEGTDALAYAEINRLHAMGLLRKNTVLVHAIALSQSDIQLVTKAGCAAVWCPASNVFLFNKTADIPALKSRIPVVLGSDSTLTGSPSLLDEMRCAGQTGFATPREIFDMVTTTPARVFKTPIPSIAKGAPADLFIAPIVDDNYYQNLLLAHASNIDAVFIQGEPEYIDASLEESFPTPHLLNVNGVAKRIKHDMRSVMKRIENKVSREILQLNPLWKMLDFKPGTQARGK